MIRINLHDHIVFLYWGISRGQRSNYDLSWWSLYFTHPNTQPTTMPYPWGQIWARGKFKSEVSVKYLLIFIDMIVYCVTKDILTRAGRSVLAAWPRWSSLLYICCRIQGRYSSTLEIFLCFVSCDSTALWLPGVNPREVRPGAVHPEAGDAHHGPAAAELAGEQRAATVAVTRVACPVTSTQLRRAWVDIEVDSE